MQVRARKCDDHGTHSTKRVDSFAGAKRWVIRRKAEVIAAVLGGLPSIEEACSRYMVTVDELLSWQSSLDRHGLAGRASSNIGCNGGLDRFRYRGEFSYGVSRSDDMDLK